MKLRKITITCAQRAAYGNRAVNRFTVSVARLHKWESAYTFMADCGCFWAAEDASVLTNYLGARAAEVEREMMMAQTQRRLH